MHSNRENDWEDQKEFREFAHYFVTLETRGREPFFKEVPMLRKLVERRWHALMDSYPHVFSEEFSMKPNAFHAIVRIRRNAPISLPEHPEEGFLENVNEEDSPLPSRVLEHAIAFFQTTTTHEWEREALCPPEIFWKQDYRVTPLPNSEALEEMREYILDNILKGGMYE